MSVSGGVTGRYVHPVLDIRIPEGCLRLGVFHTGTAKTPKLLTLPQGKKTITTKY